VDAPAGRDRAEMRRSCRTAAAPIVDADAAPSRRSITVVDGRFYVRKRSRTRLEHLSFTND
jgi:hypothetical protein